MRYLCCCEYVDAFSKKLKKQTHLLSIVLSPLCLKFIKKFCCRVSKKMTRNYQTATRRVMAKTSGVQTFGSSGS